MTDDHVRLSIKTETYNLQHPSTDQPTPKLLATGQERKTHKKKTFIAAHQALYCDSSVTGLHFVMKDTKCNLAPLL